MRKKNIIPFEKLDEYTQFGSYLCNINAMKLLSDINAFSGIVYVDGYDGFYDCIYVDTSRMNKNELIKMFVLLGKHRPNEIDEIDQNTIRFWWD